MTLETSQIELLSILSTVTELGFIAWEDNRYDTYTSIVGKKIYNIEWLYWYNSDDITIDKQVFVLSVDDLFCCFAWGTKGMIRGNRLLGKIDQRWQQYSQTLESAARMVFVPSRGEDLMNQPLAEEETETLVLTLYRATEKHLIRWIEEETDVYVFSDGKRKYIIELLQPVDNEERRMGVMIARLSAPGAVLDFACGTKGMFLIQKMLAINSPRRSIEMKQQIDILDQEIKFLYSLLLAN